MDDPSIQRITKALADPRRFAMLQQIATAAELPCQALCASIPITKATLSHHIQELEDAGLIEVRKDGKFAHLSLRKEVWRDYLGELKKRIG